MAIFFGCSSPLPLNLKIVTRQKVRGSTVTGSTIVCKKCFFPRKAFSTTSKFRSFDNRGGYWGPEVLVLVSRAQNMGKAGFPDLCGKSVAQGAGRHRARYRGWHGLSAPLDSLRVMLAVPPSSCVQKGGCRPGGALLVPWGRHNPPPLTWLEGAGLRERVLARCSRCELRTFSNFAAYR